MLKITGALGVLIVFALAVSGADDSQEAPPLTRFDPVQVRGDLKVTLLSVSRSVQFTDRFVQPALREANAGEQGTFAVPCLTVEFLVERVGNKPVKSDVGHTAGVRVFQNGQPIQELEGTVSGGLSRVRNYTTMNPRTGLQMPPVRAEKLAKLRYVLLSGIRVRDGDDIRIEFKAGHGEEVETFSFDHVPVP